MQWITGLEIRLGLRLAKKQPFLAATIVAALGLGIGIATTGFSVVESTFFGGLPFDPDDRFVVLEVRDTTGARTTLEPETVRQLGAASTIVHLGAEDAETLTVALGNDSALGRDTSAGDTLSVRGAYITPSSFRHLPYVPVLGRTLDPADGAADAVPVALIRARFWEQHFGGRSDAIGKTLVVDGMTRSIVGVLGNDAGFPANGEVWVPLASDTSGSDGTLGNHATVARPGTRYFAILQPGVSREYAEVELASIVSRALDDGAATQARPRLRLQGYTESSTSGFGAAAAMVMALVALLLVIAANIANLVHARTSARRGELALRSTLGASRKRLIGQLTAELGLLIVLAACLGVGIAHVSLARIDHMLGTERPFWLEFGLGAKTLLFVIGLAALTCVIGGIVPALRATRTRSLGPLGAHVRRGGLGIGRAGAVMMVCELAVSVALLSASLGVARGVAGIHDVARELPQDRVLTARLRGAKIVASDDAATPSVGSAHFAPLPVDRIADALDQIPGIAAFGFTDTLPGADADLRPIALEVGSATTVRATTVRTTAVAEVSPGFLETLDAVALDGRLLRDADLASGAPAVALVNASFVRTVLAGRNALGRRVRLVSSNVSDETTGDAAWHEIVGVVPDLGLSGADPNRSAGVYLPSDGAGISSRLIVATNGDPATLAGTLRQAIASVDPAIRLLRVERLEDVSGGTRTTMAGLSGAMSAMGLLTLLLSAVATYAMISFAVTRRTREIGIRVAVGASRRQIAGTVLTGAGRVVLLGCVAGIVLSLGFVQLQDRLFTLRLPASGPVVLLGVIGLLALATLVACWRPLRRALSIQPTEALRFD